MRTEFAYMVVLKFDPIYKGEKFKTFIFSWLFTNLSRALVFTNELFAHDPKFKPFKYHTVYRSINKNLNYIQTVSYYHVEITCCAINPSIQFAKEELVQMFDEVEKFLETVVTE